MIRPKKQRFSECPEHVKDILADLLQKCWNLSIDDMAWIASACLKFLAMKIGGQVPNGSRNNDVRATTAKG